MFNKNKKGLKISRKSKNVTKFKSKTPAQDRLQKFQKVITSNIEDCKKFVIENTVVEESANITKPCSINIVSTKPIQFIANKDTIANNIETNSGHKMAKTSKFKINDTKRNFSVQSSMKISDKSKNVKKSKSKTSAQDRLLNIPKLISTNPKEISSTSSSDIKHRINETDSEKLIGIIENKIHCSLDSAQKQNIDKIDKQSKNDVSVDGRIKEPSTGFGSLVRFLNRCSENGKQMYRKIFDIFQHVNPLKVRDKEMYPSYIVPDTNVFIQSLASIKTIIDEGSKLKKPNLFIPFVVLQELDQLKHRGTASVKLHAIRAIRYIYDEQKYKNPRLQGQTATTDSDHVIEINSPDDKILNCCLQLRNQSEAVTLLTNDKNLSIKAKFNEIETITAKKMLEIH